MAIRASWLLRIGPCVTFVGAENERAPSRENATWTGEWVPFRPSNCTQVTYTDPKTGLPAWSSTATDSWSGSCPFEPFDLPLPFHIDTCAGLSRTPSGQVRPPSVEPLTYRGIWECC